MNEILMSPASAEANALQSAYEAIEDDDEQSTLTAAFGSEADEKRAALNERIETLDEGVEAFEDIREQIRTMLETMDDETDDEEQRETDGSGETTEVEA
jgi:predicted  nucleic acid-binding Zn-ribbon protein